MSDAAAVRRRATGIGFFALFLAAVTVGAIIGFSVALDGAARVVAIIVLVLLAGGIIAGGSLSFTVGTRYPNVKQLGGAIDFLRIFAITIGVLGALLSLLVAADLSFGFVVAAVIACFAFLVFLVASANRPMVRGTEALNPPTL